MNEGPGGTSAIAVTDPKTRRKFLEALNKKEALEWLSDGSTSVQASLSAQWLASRALLIAENSSKKSEEQAIEVQSIKAENQKIRENLSGLNTSNTILWSLLIALIALILGYYIPHLNSGS